MISKGAFHLSGLTGQNTTIIMKISLLNYPVRTVKP